MIIYYVKVRSISVDHLGRREQSIVGYHKTREGAERRIEELKQLKEWNVYFNDAEIHAVPLND